MAGEGKTHWSFEDVDWAAFDAGLVTPELLERVKTTALVESRADFYADYLLLVFGDYPDWHRRIEAWRQEEARHGHALRRWVRLADPEFDFDGAFGDYISSIPYHDGSRGSVRGSVGGELVSRCTVEALASAYYRAIRDESREPLLRDICRRLARDEARHYKMFFTMLDEHRETSSVGRLETLWLVLARVLALSNDQIVYAAHCAGRASPDDVYVRTLVRARFLRGIYGSYRAPHLSFALALILRVLGLAPRGILNRGLTRLAVGWVAVRRVWFELRTATGAALLFGRSVARSRPKCSHLWPW